MTPAVSNFNEVTRLLAQKAGTIGALSEIIDQLEEGMKAYHPDMHPAVRATLDLAMAYKGILTSQEANTVQATRLAALLGHKLKTLSGATIKVWARWPEWDDIQAEVAEWADCKADEVAEIQTPGGDFITAQGTPVAYMERRPVVRKTERERQ